MINDIKDKTGIIAMKKELKALKRAVSFNNFESAKTVGFIFDTADIRKFNLVKDFMDFAENKSIRVFGVGYTVKSDQIAYFPYRNGVNYFGLDEVNWYGKPSNPVVAEFLKHSFDILIDLSQSEIFPIHYIFALSGSKFKITNTSIKAKYADFVLQLDNKETLDNYIQQIKHYLGIIQAK